MKKMKPHTSKQKSGENAEQRALEFLLSQKLTLLTRNYHCRMGELDLVMQQNDVLVIIEVRYRQSERFGGALESITRQKQSRIIAATQYYLMQHNINPVVRFDVVAINASQDINWIQNAFQTGL